MSMGKSDKHTFPESSDSIFTRRAWLAIPLFVFLILAALIWLGIRSTDLNVQGENDGRDVSAGLEETGPSLVAADQPVLVPPPPLVDIDDIRPLLAKDSIMAIDDPRFVDVSQAAAFMEDDERLIGVIINGDAQAYPVPILSNHEIVNDVIGGEPVAIAWCPLCFSALVFSRQVEDYDQPLTFGVSGSLLFNTLVMYDRQTDSLWSQLYGAALDGQLVDNRLAFFPSVLTEWKAWREQYPESQVLSKPLTCAQFRCGTYATNPRGSYDIDPYESYYNTAEEGVFERQIPRDEGYSRNRPKERVLGIRLAGQAIAFPYRELAKQPVINELVGGRPVLIWFDPLSETGAAYLREYEGRPLTFRSSADNPQILIDNESGSQWQATTGLVIEGPLQGGRLSPLVATPAFAFGWYAYFPTSATYGP